MTAPLDAAASRCTCLPYAQRERDRYQFHDRDCPSLEAAATQAAEQVAGLPAGSIVSHLEALLIARAFLAAQAQVATLTADLNETRRSCDYAWEQRRVAEGQVAALRQQTERVRELCDEAERRVPSPGLGLVFSSRIRAALDGPS